MNDSMNKEAWGQYWRGRTGTDKGVALVGVGIETDADLENFWQAQLADFDRYSAMLDMACGAGSVIRHAENMGFLNLSGVDISEDAIKTLTAEFPNVEGRVASLGQTKFPSEHFALIVSQFGFEYAGALNIVPEIARLLRPDGQFIAVAHSRNSAIEAEVENQLKSVTAIQETEFIRKARKLFIASMSGSDDQFNTALNEFRPKQDALLALVKSQGELAAHLYSGTQQLYERRSAYDLSDILGWLEGMDREISTFQARMSSMMEAALSEDDIETLQACFISHGLSCQPTESLRVGLQNDPIGWIIRASR